MTALATRFLPPPKRECSPLFSASMMELTKPRKAANQDDDPLSGGAGGAEDEEEAGGIANMRVVNASKVRRRGVLLYACSPPAQHEEEVHPGTYLVHRQTIDLATFVFNYLAGSPCAHLQHATER